MGKSNGVEQDGQQNGQVVTATVETTEETKQSASLCMGVGADQKDHSFEKFTEIFEKPRVVVATAEEGRRARSASDEQFSNNKLPLSRSEGSAVCDANSVAAGSSNKGLCLKLGDDLPNECALTDGNPRQVPSSGGEGEKRGATGGGSTSQGSNASGGTYQATTHTRQGLQGAASGTTGGCGGGDDPEETRSRDLPRSHYVEPVDDENSDSEDKTHREAGVRSANDPQLSYGHATRDFPDPTAADPNSCHSSEPDGGLPPPLPQHPPVNPQGTESPKNTSDIDPDSPMDTGDGTFAPFGGLPSVVPPLSNQPATNTPPSVCFHGYTWGMDHVFDYGFELNVFDYCARLFIQYIQCDQQAVCAPRAKLCRSFDIRPDQRRLLFAVPSHCKPVQVWLYENQDFGSSLLVLQQVVNALAVLHDNNCSLGGAFKVWVGVDAQVYLQVDFVDILNKGEAMPFMHPGIEDKKVVWNLYHTYVRPRLASQASPTVVGVFQCSDRIGFEHRLNDASTPMSKFASILSKLRLCRVDTYIVAAQEFTDDDIIESVLVRVYVQEGEYLQSALSPLRSVVPSTISNTWIARWWPIRPEGMSDIGCTSKATDDCMVILAPITEGITANLPPTHALYITPLFILSD